MKSTDPVCGMTVDSNSAHKSNYQGRDVYFCSASCKQKFDADPKKYAAKLSGGSR